MKNKLIVAFIFAIFLISLASVSANLGVFKQNECVSIRVLANCSSVNLTEITHGKTTETINSDMTNLGGQTFNYSFCNTSDLGTYTYSWNNICVDCSNGDCGNSFEVKGGDLTFIIIIFALAIIFLICSIFVSEEVFVYLSGVCFLIAGIYIMINGLDNISDWASRSIAFVSLGLGLLLTLGAYIYNGYSKGDYEVAED